MKPAAPVVLPGRDIGAVGHDRLGPQCRTHRFDQAGLGRCHAAGAYHAASVHANSWTVQAFALTRLVRCRIRLSSCPCCSPWPLPAAVDESRAGNVADGAAHRSSANHHSHPAPVRARARLSRPIRCAGPRRRDRNASRCRRSTARWSRVRKRIDLMLEGGDRLRAKLDNDCPPLDFYSGFYLKPTPDGMVCADRDAIRSRSGAACAIESFKQLVPKR